jgi:asparagine synthase (glutamine-hydrolysing)
MRANKSPVRCRRKGVNVCGIGGYFQHDDPALLDRMLGLMVHRGPDDAGTYREPGVGLGMRRLRSSMAGSRQPALKGRWRHPGGLQRRDLQPRACAWNWKPAGTGSPRAQLTEVIVPLYEEHGADFVNACAACLPLHS